MIGPIHNSNGAPAVQSADPVLRAELMTSAPQAGAELPSVAIGHVSETQTLPCDLPPHLHQHATHIDQIKAEYRDIEERAVRAREIDALRSKLLLGRSAGEAKSGNSFEIKNAVDIALAMSSNKNLDQKDVLGSKSASDPVHQIKKSPVPTTSQDKNLKDRALAGQEDQQAVLSRIDEAINALNKIMEDINTDQTASGNRILNLSGTVSSLNTTRASIDKTPLSLDVASTAMNMIMTNIKTAVVSHGNVSTDIVRRVLI